jgi:hypothetical protein
LLGENSRGVFARTDLMLERRLQLRKSLRQWENLQPEA